MPTTTKRLDQGGLIAEMNSQHADVSTLSPATNLEAPRLYSKPRISTPRTRIPKSHLTPARNLTAKASYKPDHVLHPLQVESIVL